MEDDMLDERYLMHRLKSTSLAGIVGAVSIGVWLLIQFYRDHVFRLDLMIILGIIAIVKVGALLYFKRTN